MLITAGSSARNEFRYSVHTFDVSRDFLKSCELAASEVRLHRKDWCVWPSQRNWRERRACRTGNLPEPLGSSQAPGSRPMTLPLGFDTPPL